MKKNKPQEMTMLEASDYFDEHDIFEFDDAKEVAGVKFKLQKKQYVALDIGLFRKIRTKARKLHKSEDLLIKEWLTEKVS